MFKGRRGACAWTGLLGCVGKTSYQNRSFGITLIELFFWKLHAAQSRFISVLSHVSWIGLWRFRVLTAHEVKVCIPSQEAYTTPQKVKTSVPSHLDLGALIYHMYSGL